eukprot:TRINITY_DN2010_c0_g2_i3.p1 TRINITY_DN2010_c0_g2~~TRINITY_DN2010_c0_g2_i3.p1  ORF type:complete len:211 (+),score=37.55 TRINITY_DN2010_c0_g2_i3:913-1545(+)
MAEGVLATSQPQSSPHRKRRRMRIKDLTPPDFRNLRDAIKYNPTYPDIADSSSALLKAFEAKLGHTVSDKMAEIQMKKRLDVILNELRRLDTEGTTTFYVDEIPEHVAGPRLRRILHEFWRKESPTVPARDSSHMNRGSPRPSQRVNLQEKAKEVFFNLPNVCGVASTNDKILLELTTTPNDDFLKTVRDFESANSCNIKYKVVGHIQPI